MSHATAVLDQLRKADREGELPEDLRAELEALEEEAEDDDA